MVAQLMRRRCAAARVLLDSMREPTAQKGTEMKIILFSCYTLFCIGCFGQEPKAAPFLNKVELGLIAGNVAARGADWASTEQFLRRNFAEGQLPKSLVNNKVGFAMFQAGVVAGVTAGSYFAYKHHHRKLGWLLQAVEIASVSYIAKSNYDMMAKYGQGFQPVTSSP
jgi:hypothetical protein